MSNEPELELSDEVRDLFLAGKLDDLLEYVSKESMQQALKAVRDKKNAARNKRYQEDPEARAQNQARWKDRYHNDVGFREHVLRSNRKNRDRVYKENPEKRAQDIIRDGERRKRKMRDDPEYAERIRLRERDRARETRARKKAEREAQKNEDQ